MEEASEEDQVILDFVCELDKANLKLHAWLGDSILSDFVTRRIFYASWEASLEEMSELRKLFVCAATQEWFLKEKLACTLPAKTKQLNKHSMATFFEAWIGLLDKNTGEAGTRKLLERYCCAVEKEKCSETGGEGANKLLERYRCAVEIK